MKSVNNPRSTIFRLKRFISILGITVSLLYIGACDFQNPSDFETPTWFIDLKIPLVQEKYTLDGIVDNKQIFSTDDSLGMQLIFEDTLPKTSIDASYLEVDVGAEIEYEGTPQTAPSLTVIVDTTIDVTIPFTPGLLTDINGIPFTIPPTDDQQIFASTWNDILAVFDTTFPAVEIPLPSIDESELPEFITEVSGVMIQADGSSDSSFFFSSITNDGMLTDITNARFSMITGSSVSPDTLADHEQSTVVKDETFTRSTLIGDQQIKDAIRILFDFDVAAHTNETDTLTINAGDLIQVNFAIRIRIAGVDEAVVEIAEYDMPTELPPVTFPSTVEIYSGIFKTGTAFGINEIAISNLKSTYPFYMDFIMNFRNFVPPPTGGDSVKVDTVLFEDYTTYSKTFAIDGYTF